jgi:uncharacterized protein (DUF2126 family)
LLDIEHREALEEWHRLGVVALLDGSRRFGAIIPPE